MANKSRLEAYLPLVIALVGVIGTALGATVSHIWTRSTMLEEQVLDMKKKAYSDFLQGQSLLWQTPSQEKEANQLNTSAKLSILLTGSHDVLYSMATYWASAHKYSACPDPELRKKDAVIYTQMRRDFFKTLGITDSPDVEAAIVVPFLWNCVLPGESLRQASGTR